VASKKQGTCASADSASDAVQVDETVRVPKYFINGTEFTSIDFWAGYKAVLGWRTVPAEAASVQIYKFVVITGGEG
jgi:hypothetical protein